MSGTLDYRYYKTPGELAKWNRNLRKWISKPHLNPIRPYTPKATVDAPGRPQSLPLPDSKTLTIYTDASWYGSGNYGWAYVVHHLGDFEEVWGAHHGAASNTDAEILSACRAIEEVDPPKGFCLVFDFMGIMDTATGKSRIRSDGQARLKRLVDDPQPILRWFPGHGSRTPKYLKRCDVLAGGGK